MVEIHEAGRIVIPIDTDTGRLADGGKVDKAEQNTGMTGKQCMDAIEQLSHGQGFYERLHHELKEKKRNDPKGFKAIMKAFEAEKFNDPVDLVLYLEG